MVVEKRGIPGIGRKGLIDTMMLFYASRTSSYNHVVSFYGRNRQHIRHTSMINTIDCLKGRMHDEPASRRVYPEPCEIRVSMLDRRHLGRKRALKAVRMTLISSRSRRAR
jgi:hypothetical protein